MEFNKQYRKGFEMSCFSKKRFRNNYMSSFGVISEKNNSFKRL